MTGNRMTLAQVQHKLDTANRMLGFTPPVPYPSTGTLVLDRAYGGTQVNQVCNESGGQRHMSRDGFGTLRQAATFLDGFIRALEITQGI